MSERLPSRLLRGAAGITVAFVTAFAVLATSGHHRADATAQQASGPEEYASPLELLFSPDGARLFVLCNRSDQVRVLDAANFAVLKNIAVGHIPRGFSLSPRGDRLYVTNTWDDTLSVIDTGTLQVIATWPVRAEPSSVVTDRQGKWVFVANRVSNDVAVLDAHTGEEQKRLLAGRGASYLTLSPDGSRLYASHVYPNLGAYRTPPQSELTIIDPVRAIVLDRMPMPSVAGVFHLAFSSDARLGVAAELHPKNLIPLAHVEHGWAFADTLTLFGVDVGKPMEIPLDELERYAARPFAVVIAPDKSHLYVSCSGSEIVIVVDLPKLLRYVREEHGSPAQDHGSSIQDLSASARYVSARIPVGHDPRGMVLSRDGRRLLVANRLDDSISVIDTRSNRVTSTIRMQGPAQISPLRRGEQTFYTARYAFQGQFGCANCHIDSTYDGVSWDLEPDGFGRDIVDNRLIEDIRGTEPYKWNGGNPNIPTECGPRTEMYFWRSQTYNDKILTDLTLYIRSLPPRPNRSRLPLHQLTAAQERGKVLFERALDKFGQPIPATNRCSYCHSGPKGTNQKSFDVGTRKSTDNSGLLDTPQLVNVALTAPYLHDGSARSLEEIWTLFNPNDKHGRTNDLTKDQLNDLIEYLRMR